MTSPTLPLIELDRYAEYFIAQPISQMPGVGVVDYHGQMRPAVRVRIDPEKLAGLDLTLEDLTRRHSASTANAPKGTLNGPTSGLGAGHDRSAPRRGCIPQLGGRLSQRCRDPAAGRRRGGGRTGGCLPGRLVQGSVRSSSMWRSRAGPTWVATIQAIKDRLPSLSASLPPAAGLHIVGDRTQTIQASVSDVQFTMLITIGLVIMVIFVFLRIFWAMLVPSLTILLSLFATFAAMYALGYSLDNLSLMGLTIAIGFVVDDAIVVIENILRHLEKGLPPVEAALRGAREVGFTIVSMTVSLIAVFIPILLMGGLVGRLSASSRSPSAWRSSYPASFP